MWVFCNCHRELLVWPCLMELHACREDGSCMPAGKMAMCLSTIYLAKLPLVLLLTLVTLPIDTCSVKLSGWGASNRRLKPLVIVIIRWVEICSPKSTFLISPFVFPPTETHLSFTVYCLIFTLILSGPLSFLLVNLKDLALHKLFSVLSWHSIWIVNLT